MSELAVACCPRQLTPTGVTVSVHTAPGRLPAGAFGLDVAVRVLEFYGSYFACPFPLPKLDLVVIPGFAHVGMENWGVVTFEEPYLLVCIHMLKSNPGS